MQNLNSALRTSNALVQQEQHAEQAAGREQAQTAPVLRAQAPDTLSAAYRLQQQLDSLLAKGSSSMTLADLFNIQLTASQLAREVSELQGKVREASRILEEGISAVSSSSPAPGKTAQRWRALGPQASVDLNDRSILRRFPQLYQEIEGYIALSDKTWDWFFMQANTLHPVQEADEQGDLILEIEKLQRFTRIMEQMSSIVSGTYVAPGSRQV